MDCGFFEYCSSEKCTFGQCVIFSKASEITRGAGHPGVGRSCYKGHTSCQLPWAPISPVFSSIDDMKFQPRVLFEDRISGWKLGSTNDLHENCLGKFILNLFHF